MPCLKTIHNHRLVLTGPLVLESKLYTFNFLIADRDQTVSRRSKPSSRTALMIEQINPWKLVHLQDAMSRHRGAKQSNRWEL